MARLTITRRKSGKRWTFHRADGTAISDPATIDRLNALAVPPAYADVRYAAKPRAHLQAVGVDAAGRLQYRYHPDWERVREARKEKRLMLLATALPRLRRRIRRELRGEKPTRNLAAAACIALVMETSIRAGGIVSETTFGHRGATTLLKSNVTCDGGVLTLSFKGKGGKQIARGARSAALCRALTVLRSLPGRHIFQYRGDDGAVHRLAAADVNARLKELVGADVSLKDFRTLQASRQVAAELVGLEPSPSASGRKRQIKTAILAASEELANTPTVCRKSYVHAAIVEAFETGRLRRLKARVRKTTRPDLVAAMLAPAA
jgi:DNA topoisomerase-1